MRNIKKLFLLPLSTAIILGALLILPLSNAHAAGNININYSGWTSVGPNEIQVDAHRFTLDDAEITITGSNFEKKEYISYQWVRPISAVSDGTRIIATKGITFLSDTTTPVPGAIELRWKNVARLRDGTECDIYMKIDNVTISTPRVGDSNSDYGAVSEVALLTERSDYHDRVAFSAFGNENVLGAQFDVSIRAYNSNTGELVEKDMAFGYEDLDYCDRVYTLNTYGSLKCWERTDRLESESEYSESITLIDGVIGNNIYTEPEDVTTLHFMDTTYGRNTRIVPTAATVNNAIESRKSGFSFLANSANHKIHWAGSTCSTVFGFIPANKVVVSAQGDYADKITYDESDDEVLWKETKTITATPDEGYYISKIIIDGIEAGDFEVDDNTGKVTYSFVEMIADHEIIFEALPLPAPGNPNTDDGILVNFTALVGAAALLGGTIAAFRKRF